MKLERLRDLRIQCGLTQIKLGEKFSLSGNAVGQYESGIREPSLKTLKDMAKFFDVSVDYLIGNDNLGSDVTLVQPMYTEKQKSCIDLIMQLDEELLNTAEIYLSGLSARSETFTIKKLR